MSTSNGPVLIKESDVIVTTESSAAPDVSLSYLYFFLLLVFVLICGIAIGMGIMHLRNTQNKPAVLGGGLWGVI